jgi:DNA primase catalytic core
MLRNSPPDWNKYWENVSNNFKSIVEPRLNIESVYGNHVFEKLEKNSHDWKACCPFHEDKSPSFVIYSKNLHYHCFGCQEHGTPEKFLSKTKNLSRKEAIVELAHTAGVDESHVFSNANTQNKLRDNNVEGKLNTIRTNGIHQEIEIENKRWEAITDETSSLFHRINMLETSANRIIEMEKIRLSEIDKLRELNSIIKTKLSDKIPIDENDKVTRMYKFNIGNDTTLKCQYELIFNGTNLDKIHESTWVEKQVDNKIKNLINEEHSTYHIKDGEVTKTNGKIQNHDEFSIERKISSSYPYSNLNLQITDIKEVGNKIKERNDNLNKIIANELHDLIDNSLKLPKNELKDIIDSINGDKDINNILINLPDNNKIKILNKLEGETLEKSIFLIRNNKEENIFNQKLERSIDGIWIDKSSNSPIDNKILDLTGEQSAIVLTLVCANNSFKENLYSNTKESNEAKTYLYNRGLSDQDIEEWELGYVSPGLIYRGTQEKGWKTVELQSAGLLSEKGKEHFFGHRITFPIKSSEGLIQGFSARNIMDAHENSPKYINSPSTKLFSKGKTLYGLDKAKDYILEKNNAIITEGFMDTIQMHKHGFKNTVAVMGTALTESHIHQIKNISENVTLCFDNDKAGTIAFNRSTQIAGPFMRVQKLTLENAKDPDEFLKEYGSNKLDDAILKSKTISVPAQFVQKFEKNSTKLSHALYNPNLDIEI